jgi:hypothetical protein
MNFGSEVECATELNIAAAAMAVKTAVLIRESTPLSLAPLANRFGRREPDPRGAAGSAHAHLVLRRARPLLQLQPVTQGTSGH